MSSRIQNTERVLSILRDLPPAKVNEVIDFAEYLKSRTRKTTPRKQAKIELPLYHLGAISSNAFDRESLYGERLDFGIA